MATAVAPATVTAEAQVGAPETVMATAVAPVLVPVPAGAPDVSHYIEL